MKLLKSRESLTLVAILAAMFGLAVLVWTVWKNSPSVSFTAAANTRPARETRQAQTATAVALQTRAARQTRRAPTPTINSVQAIQTPGTIAVGTATPTRDPRTPTPDLGTPEPTGVVIDETPTPWPTYTPLPPLPQEKRDGFWSENLDFGEPVSHESELSVTFPNLKSVGGGLEVSPDDTQIATSIWNGETTPWLGKQPPGVKIGPVPIWELVLFNLSTGKVTSLARGYNPAWSPDGGNIAFIVSDKNTDSRSLHIVNVVTGETRNATTLASDEPPVYYAWVSNSELAYYKNQFFVFDTKSGDTRSLVDAQVLKVDPEYPLTYITSAPQVGVFALASSKEILVFAWQDGLANLIRRLEKGVENSYWNLSPDGQVLAFPNASTRQLNLEGVYDEQLSIQIFPIHGSIFFAGWSPDSSSVFFADSDGVGIVNRDGSGLKRLSSITIDQGPEWILDGTGIIWLGASGQLLTSAVERK